MKSLFTLVLSFCFFMTAQAQLNMELRGQIDYNPDLNDIWGWADGNGNEYAIVGAQTGVSVVNVTDPDNPTEITFLPGVNSIWRDIKTWGTNAYVTNETGGGVTVIDLSDLPNDATAYQWAPAIPGLGTLNDCHNIFIDEFGIAYLVGCNLNSGGLLYVNVDTPDGTPEYVDKGSNVYSHDVYVRDNKAYSSEIQQGVFSIYDVTDKANTILLGEQATPSTTTHNAWLSDNGQFLFTTDETSNAPIGSYDISDPENIIELDQYKPFETLDEGVVPHNVHVWDDYLIVSYYTDGCILIDASKPDNLIEVGNFDTWLTGSGGFDGAWGAYPFLPSGTVLVSDQGNGLYVLTPTYVRAAFLEGSVVSSVDQSPIAGAKVSILETSTFANTTFDGEFKTGYHTGGTYMVEGSAPGFANAQVEVVLVNDQTEIIQIQLDPLTSFSLSANVLDEDTGAPVPNASVKIYNDVFEFSTVADASGNLQLNEVFEGTYEVAVGKWGYISKIIVDQDFDENNNSSTFEITSGLEDNFAVDLGWEVSGNNTSGDWELAIPQGLFVSQAGIFITPEADDQTDDGPGAYVTDNGQDIFNDAVNGGTTIITSPLFDLSQYVEPMISFSTWFLAANPNTGDPGANTIDVSLTDGTTTVELASLSMDDLYGLEWNNREIKVKDFIVPGTEMQLIVSVLNNSGNLVEAGFDNFKVFAGEPSAVNNIPEKKSYLMVSPNPSTSFFEIKGELKDFEEGILTIYSVLGRAQSQHALRAGDETLLIGKNLTPGIYLAQLTVGDDILKTVRLVKQ